MSTSSRAKRTQNILSTLANGTPDVTGCAVVSDDGLIIGSVLPAEADEESVGGMASVLLSLGTRVAGELTLGGMDQVLIRAGEGNCLMVKSGEGALLLVMMTPKAKLGLIFLDVRRAARELAETL